MKEFVASVLLVVVVVVFDTVMAQDRPKEVAARQSEIAADVQQAAMRAGVAGGQVLLVPFMDSAAGQMDAVAQVYSKIPPDVRVNRLARYLSAKASASIPRSNSVTADDLADFNWSYIANDYNFSAVRLDSPKPVRLLRVESPSGQFTFVGGKTDQVKPGSWILLPVSKDQAGDNFTLTFAFGGAKALWTGTPSATLMSVSASATTKGCEIRVNSDPDQASILFNGKEWHDLTNTAVVQDPGTWEVIIRRKDRKDWREQRTLGPGESWTINAKLKK